MKKTVLIFAAAILTGCALDRQNDYDVEYALEFQPAMYMHVATDGTDRFPADRTFGICAWSLPERDAWEDDNSKADVYLPVKEAVPMSDGKVWAFDEPVLWPAKNRHLTFLAYSPYDAAAECSVEEGVCFGNVDVLEDQTDLLYTEPLADMDKADCGGVVTVPFRHALCSMNFRVKNRVADDEKIILKKIILDAARHCGDFRSMPDPRWTLDARTARFVFFDGDYQTGHQPSEIGDNILMIPQALETPVTVVYEFVTHAGTSITQELKTTLLQKELLPGKNYTFTITVGIDDVKFLVEIIEGFLNI